MLFTSIALDSSQPFADFEAGRPGLAVDEDACLSGFFVVVAAISAAESEPMLDAVPDRFRTADTVVGTDDPVACRVDHIEGDVEDDQQADPGDPRIAAEQLRDVARRHRHQDDRDGQADDEDECR